MLTVFHLLLFFVSLIPVVCFHLHCTLLTFHPIHRRFADLHFNDVSKHYSKEITQIKTLHNPPNVASAQFEQFESCHGTVQEVEWT